MQPYKVPAGPAQAEVTDRRSRFIGQVWPVTSSAEAMQCVESLRRLHYQARHVVFALRLHDEGAVRSSDDGEPQGTAGAPLLELLERREQSDCLVTVVRYFGGVLLGTGGLLRAYTQAGRQALEAAGELWRVPAVQCEMRADYAAYGRLTALPAAFGGETSDIRYADDVRWTVRLPALCRDAFARSEALREAGIAAPAWEPAPPLSWTEAEFEARKQLFL